MKFNKKIMRGISLAVASIMLFSNSASATTYTYSDYCFGNKNTDASGWCNIYSNGTYKTVSGDTFSKNNSQVRIVINVNGLSADSGYTSRYAQADVKVPTTGSVNVLHIHYFDGICDIHEIRG